MGGDDANDDYVDLDLLGDGLFEKVFISLFIEDPNSLLVHCSLLDEKDELTSFSGCSSLESSLPITCILRLPTLLLLLR